MSVVGMRAAATTSVELIEKELTEAIIGACIEVSNELGAGYLESVYERALVVALRERGLEIQEQAPLDVYFRGQLVGQFFADVLVGLIPCGFVFIRG